MAVNNHRPGIKATQPNASNLQHISSWLVSATACQGSN